MKITWRMERGVPVARVSGRLDGDTSHDFEKIFGEGVPEGAKAVVLDLRDLEYLSSAGIRCLLVAVKRIKGDGGAVCFAGARDYIREVLEIAGLTSVFPLEDSVDGALDRLR